MTNIESLVELMTLEEKAALCTGASAWMTTPIKRLGVPEMFVSDGPHGIRCVPEDTLLINRSLPATCFPTASSLAAGWDGDLLRELGQALAEEAIALGVSVILGPGTNMKRSPLCGRNFESRERDRLQTAQGVLASAPAWWLARSRRPGSIPASSESTSASQLPCRARRAGAPP